MKNYMIYENKYFKFFIENPLKTWWDARKYFKRPKMSLHFFSSPTYNCPYASYKWIGKILDITSCDVIWKDKYNSPRHERSPYIWVCFFHTFGFSINFRASNDYFKEMCYWEYLLSYLHYHNDLNKWEKWSNCYNDEVVDTPSYSLNKKGKKEYGKHL